MINNKVPLSDKLELIEKFYKDIWETDLVQSKNPGPNIYTANYMMDKIKTSTLPGFELLTVEDHWMKARMFYYMAGDESMLTMEGDVGPQSIEDLEKFVDAGADKVYPEEIRTEYIGRFCSYENNILKIYKGLNPNPESYTIIEFTPLILRSDLDRLDLTRPIKVVTIAFKLTDGKVTGSKNYGNFQHYMNFPANPFGI